MSCFILRKLCDCDESNRDKRIKHYNSIRTVFQSVDLLQRCWNVLPAGEKHTNAHWIMLENNLKEWACDAQLEDIGHALDVLDVCIAEYQRGRSPSGTTIAKLKLVRASLKMCKRSKLAQEKRRNLGVSELHANPIAAVLCTQKQVEPSTEFP